MFNRKGLLIALMAVVLLGSFIDGRVSVDQNHSRKPQASVMSGIAAVDPTLNQASSADPMSLHKPRRRPRVKSSIAAVDQNIHQLSFTDRKHRRPRV